MAQLFFLGTYVYGDLITHFDDPTFLGVGPWYVEISLLLFNTISLLSRSFAVCHLSDIKCKHLLLADRDSAQCR